MWKDRTHRRESNWSKGAVDGLWSGARGARFGGGGGTLGGVSPPPLRSASTWTPWQVVFALSVAPTLSADERVKIDLSEVPPLRSDLVLISRVDAVE